MKQTIFTLLLFLLCCGALPAQTPLYLLYEPDCTNQLEYQYTYTGQNLLMYSVIKGPNELYFFVVSDKDPVSTPKMPAGTVTCRNSVLDANVIDNINAGGRMAYMVFKVQNGYLSRPVESAGYIARSGTYFAFRSPNYDFVMDTANIDYARNLSRPGVPSPVYLTGRRSQECLQLYAFRLEPTHAESPRADVEVIPGIGIISDRSGLTGSEMEQNVFRLLRVNGIGLDDYLHAVCTHSLQKTDNTGSFITTLPAGTNPSDAFRTNFTTEPDKEGYSTQPPGAQNSGYGQLANCPVPPGPGYHIVQPGDSLGAIARAYNLDTRSLMQWNGIKDARQIKVCDQIWLSPQSAPTQSAGTHLVQKGETLYGIARKYNMTEATIRQLNNFPASGEVTIKPGQRLSVSKSAAAVPAKPQNTGKPAAPASTTGRMQYRVQKNETLNSVAWKYGYTPLYFRHINRNNPNLSALSNDDLLPEGMVLLVSDTRGEREDLASFTGAAGQPAAWPDTAPAGVSQKFEFIGEHIVQSDDTLASIAQRYGIRPERLAAANNLRAGQEPAVRSILKIPKN
mgnify:CR=1 FL=1